MDLCGIWASLCFPSIVWGFSGGTFSRFRDLDLGLACVRAYNDWVLEEWCGAEPQRFIPCQLAWLADPATAAAEVRRNADRGFRAVTFPENPEGQGLPSLYGDHWDPFLAACEETGTVINLHVGSSGSVPRPSSVSPIDAIAALFPINGMCAAVDWIFAKIPVKFPGLRIVLSEAGVSWVPMILERLGRSYQQREASLVWGASDPHPALLFRRNFWFTSIEDPSAFRMLELIGADHVMVETDYPHQDTTWPRSQAVIRSEMAHLEPALVRKVCYENAAELYRHPGPPESWLRRSAAG
jgi:predicted TIM-barrel fold metal-dependent hydrolase